MEDTSYMRLKWSLSAGSFGQCPWVPSWQQKSDIWEAADIQTALTHSLMEDFPKLSWSFNQKHLEGWVVSTTQKAQETSGFCWAQKPAAWSWQKGRSRRPHGQRRISCRQKGGLLVFPVYTTRTTWIHFGLHRAKVHLFKYRKQFWNPTNGKQVILWVIISN